MRKSFWALIFIFSALLLTAGSVWTVSIHCDVSQVQEQTVLFFFGALLVMMPAAVRRRQRKVIFAIRTK